MLNDKVCRKFSVQYLHILKLTLLRFNPYPTTIINKGQFLKIALKFRGLNILTWDLYYNFNEWFMNVKEVTEIHLSNKLMNCRGCQIMNNISLSSSVC